jgi:hypothetical protein
MRRRRRVPPPARRAPGPFGRRGARSRRARHPIARHACLVVVSPSPRRGCSSRCIYLFTSWFAALFSTMLWPILGILFAPTTLLWYAAVQRWFDGQWTLWPIVGLVVALLLDGVPARLRRRR